MMDPLDWAETERVIDRIAEIAQAFGEEAGIGQMEVAGLLVSYLAAHPRDIEPALRHGLSELPSDWIERGRLTWTAQNGRIVHPDHARRARIIKKMERNA